MIHARHTGALLQTLLIPTENQTKPSQGPKAFRLRYNEFKDDKLIPCHKQHSLLVEDQPLFIVDQLFKSSPKQLPKQKNKPLRAQNPVLFSGKLQRELRK